MIKDIDNAIIIEANINTTDAETAKDGDIVAYNKTTDEWVVCKTGLTLTNTAFGIICDTKDGETKRLICIDGLVETNIAEAGHDSYEMLFFNSATNYMSFTAPLKRIPNAYLIKYLSNKYGKIKGLVKIESNTNYEIVVSI